MAVSVTRRNLERIMDLSNNLNSAAHIQPRAELGKLGSNASAASDRARERANFNSAVVQTSMAASIEAGNEPLALLFKSAVESLNELLQADFGDNAIENALSQDNSAEATAQRIVSLSTGFFEAYKEQHAGEDEATVLENFMATIRAGFEQGFQEAQEILQGLEVLTDDIAADINRTHELVLEGYLAFESAQRGDAEPTTG